MALCFAGLFGEASNSWGSLPHTTASKKKLWSQGQSGKREWKCVAFITIPKHSKPYWAVQNRWHEWWWGGLALIVPYFLFIITAERGGWETVSSQPDDLYCCQVTVIFKNVCHGHSIQWTLFNPYGLSHTQTIERAMLILNHVFAHLFRYFEQNDLADQEWSEWLKDLSKLGKWCQLMMNSSENGGTIQLVKWTEIKICINTTVD